MNGMTHREIAFRLALNKTASRYAPGRLIVVKGKVNRIHQDFKLSIGQAGNRVNCGMGLQWSGRTL